MVGIGLGPTDGYRMLVCLPKKRPPRRVQTDAYHRPYVLNYSPYALTSFFRFPPSGEYTLAAARPDVNPYNQGTAILILSFEGAKLSASG